MSVFADTVEEFVHQCEEAGLHDWVCFDDAPDYDLLEGLVETRLISEVDDAQREYPTLWDRGEG